MCRTRSWHLAALIAVTFSIHTAHAGSAADFAKDLLGQAAAEGLTLPGPIPIGSTPLQLAALNVSIPQGQDVVLVQADLLLAGPKLCHATLTISSQGIELGCKVSLATTRLRAAMAALA